jgi:hypothetical protein
LVKMPLLNLLVSNTDEEKLFFKMIRKKGQSSDFVKNPFRVKMKFIEEKTLMLVLLDIELLYPKMIPAVGLFLSFVGVIFWWPVMIIGGLCLSSIIVLWSKQFFFMVMKKGRRKIGLKGRIKSLKDSDALKTVIAWGK